MADQTKAPTQSHDAEKAQERKRRPEPPQQEHAQGIASEAVALGQIVGDSAMELPVERHATLLSDPRFSHPVNAVQRARLVNGLQHSYGNTYVQRLLKSRTVQPKLTVTDPDDEHEKQADRVAEQSVGVGTDATPQAIAHQLETVVARAPDPLTKAQVIKWNANVVAPIHKAIAAMLASPPDYDKVIKEGVDAEVFAEGYMRDWRIPPKRRQGILPNIRAAMTGADALDSGDRYVKQCLRLALKCARRLVGAAPK